MKKIYKVLSLIALPSVLILYSYSTGSPGGKSGSVGDGGHTCTDCHGGTAQTQTGWITTNIPTEGFTAGQTYTITATGTHNGVVKFGFELTAEDAFGGKVGAFTITDPTRTQFTNANAAVTHTSNGTGVTGNSSSWSMDWTAPTPAPQSVKFYAAFNAANGNGLSTGDVIYKSSVAYNLYVPLNPQIVSVEPNNEQQGYEGELVINGNQTEWTTGVNNVSFKFHDDNSIFFEATNITVNADDLLTVNVIIPDSINIGTYDVWVDDISLSNGFTVDIYDNINDNYLSNFVTLFPNPSSDNTTINAPQNSLINIIDISGRVILQTNTGNSSAINLNVSSYEKGIYFVQILNNGNLFTQKLIVR